MTRLVVIFALVFAYSIAWLPIAPISAAAQINFHLVQSGSQIEVTVQSGDLKVTQAQLAKWIQNAADSVTTYYGRFPVSRLLLEIQPFNGKGVRGGKTFPMHGGYISIRVGHETTEQDLDSDWMMTHEMVHLSFPSLPDENHWMEEGLATYVEPIARIQAGYMDASQMWSDLVRDLPKGLPREGDQGLDHTHTWGRTYWGGALFCFLADVQIRRETQNKKGLQDAMRGILSAGGDITKDWSLPQALKVGDRATGTTVLTDLYAEMKDKPGNVDLDTLWKELGLRTGAGGLQFVNDATLAKVRESITQAPSTPRQ
jgi:hypothetical protein